MTANERSLRLFAPQKGDSVTVRRRRRDADGPQGRAEAPHRRRERQTPPGGGSGGGGGFRPSAGGSGGGRRLPTWMLVLLVVGYIVLQVMGGGGDDQQSTPPQSAYTPNVQPTAIQNFPPPAASAGSGDTWLVMLYQDADDQVLEKDIYIDLNEAERVGSSDQVHIVAQIDRYRGAYSGDGDWTSTRRYYVTQDSDLNAIHSEVAADLGEVNMASGDSLRDFVVWAAKTFPADHYVLILSDHGMGWPGGWTDPTSSGTKESAPIASLLGNALYLDELDRALGEIRQQSGIEQFDIIGMDACLMAQIEVAAALAPHARYFIASEETEPALGWAYTGFLQALVDNPGIAPADLSRLVVQSYIVDDQRIVDEGARADFLRQGSPLGGLFGASSISAQDLARQLGRDITMSAIDLQRVPALMESLNTLAYQMQNTEQTAVASARNYAQSFTNVFGRKTPPSYIDLGNFVAILLRQENDPALQEAGQAVLEALGETVIAEKHGRGKRGASGLAIYFPNSTLYRSPYTGAQSYTTVAGRFAADSLWDDFLAYHYNDQTFRPDTRQAVIPAPDAPSRVPGAGQFQVSPIALSAESAAPDRPVELSTQISGENIGYVYWFAGYYDQEAGSIFVADTDYLESPQSREVDGVTYPQWPQAETFTLNFSWNPTVFVLTNGEESATALFNPEAYGTFPEEAVYTVDGIYTFAESGERRRARLYFQNGTLVQIFGFTGSEDTGTPHEITPQDGDTFTLLEKWMDLDAGGRIQDVVWQEGATFTFDGQPFRWEETYAAQGEYVVGFIVTDLDGNGQAVYARLTVH